MKKILRNLMTLLCVLTALVSCSENGDKIYLDGFSASSLMASGSDVTLSLATKDDVVLSLAWKNPTLLSSDETMPATSETLLTYLQVSATQDFATTKDYTVSNLSKAFIGGDLNAAAKELGLTPNQSAPLYFRIKSQMGANLEAAYSNVCTVNVTPYLIDMSYINIWDQNQTKILTYLYSPNSDGVYTGYMNASSWLNFKAKENNGEVWGNSSTAGTFAIDNSESAWTCWFPGVSGIYYTVIDTQNKEWKATAITAMTLNGEAMTYDAANYAWKYVITTTADNTPISIVATGAEYNKSTDTDDASAIAKTMNYTLADGVMTDSETAGSVNIPAAGTYTVTVKVGEKSQLEYSIEEGDQTGGDDEDDSESVLDKGYTLCMYDTEKSTLLATMTKESRGVYTCTYKPNSWENFYFVFVDDQNVQQVVYGADGEQYKLTSSEGYWKIWFGEENGETEYTVTADLNTMTWNYK